MRGKHWRQNQGPLGPAGRHSDFELSPLKPPLEKSHLVPLGQHPTGAAALSAALGLLSWLVSFGIPPAHAMPLQSPSNPLPLAMARVQWDPQSQHYLGRAVYEVMPGEPTRDVGGDSPDKVTQKSESPISLAIYLNRSLAWSEENRVDKEFNAIGFPGEDVWTADRRGAFLVEKVSWASGAQETESCAHPSSPEKMEQLLERSASGADGLNAASYDLSAFDTVLSVRRPQNDPQKGSGCRVLVVDFRVAPPRSKGNFGMTSDSRHIFSGPLIPMVQGEFHRTMVEYRGVFASCFDCQTLGPRKTRQAYDRFPSPIHLSLDREIAPAVLDLNGFKIGILGSAEGDSVSGAVASLTEIVSQEAWTRRLKPGPSGVHLMLSTEAIVDRLALTQPGEVQIGPSLFKTSPFFSKYHRAAFEREVYATLGERLLNEESPPLTWQDYRFHGTLNSYFAFHEIQRRFDGLDAIKKISSKFDFVPLFDDILQGKALQNNEVFLGEREPPSRVDVQVPELFIPTLSGKEFDARLVYCGDKDLQQNFSHRVEKVFLGRESLTRLRKSLRDLPWSRERCPLGLDLLMSAKPVVESFAVERLEWGDENDVIRFSRRSDPSFDSSLFSIQNDSGDPEPEYRDSPRLSILGADGKPPEWQEVWISDGRSQAKIERKVSSSHAVVATIEGPTLGSSTEQHRTPREYKLRITGFKFRYDSKDVGSRIESGMQFRLLGDDFRRSFSLSAALDAKQTEVNAGFGLDISQLFGISPTLDVASDEPPLNSVLSLPVFLGIAEVFPHQGSSTSSLVAEFGLADSIGSPLVPSGYALGTRIKWQILEDSRPVSIYSQDFRLTYDQPMGRLTTISMRPLVGYSNGPVKLSDYVPGSSEVYLESAASDEYFALTSEVKSVVGDRYNFDILGSLLFQNLVVYAAHHVASGVSVLSSRGKVSDLVQSAEVGLQLFGSVFGAKNQSVALSVTRTLSNNPRNAFAITIGR